MRSGASGVFLMTRPLQFCAVLTAGAVGAGKSRDRKGSERNFIDTAKG